MPFDLPKGWVWVKLGNIGNVITGSTPSKNNLKYYGDNYPFFKPTDLDAGINTINALDNLSKEGYNCSRKLPSNSVLVTCIGATIGKTGLIKVEGACNQQINAVIPNLKLISPEYLYYYVISEHFQNEIESNASATTLAILNKSNFEKLLVIVPPLAEQRRIVSVIKSAFALIDEIEDNKASLEQIIKQAKAKTLDLAIRGKLVSQDPNDEPAFVLLEKIKAEQKKADKNVEIVSDNLPYAFELPTGWVWCRVCNVFQITMGQSPDGTSVTNNDSGVEFHQGKVNFGKIYLENSNLYTDEPTRIAEANSLLLCVRAPVGILNITTRKICIGRGLCAIQPFNKMDLLFAYYWLKTLENTFNQKATGSTFTAISGDIIRNELIPLPPLEEQKRIAECIETIFNQLDEIEQSIKA
jgi:type I restriction enzyme S subunit